MNYKKKKYIILVTSLLVIIVSLIVGSPESVGLCDKNDLACIHSYIDSYSFIMVPFFILSIPLFLLSCLLLFFKEEIFNKWLKFATIYVPISIILILIASPTGDMFFPSLKEMLIFALPVIFFIASLVQITYLHKKSKK